jgi:M6 family metalloprotease-like protein
MPMPFYDEEFTFQNPDGSSVKVKGWGNQHYAVFETLDGYTVTKDPNTQFYTYAELSNDKTSLLSSGVAVGESDPAAIGIRKHLRIRRDSAKKQAMNAPMLRETRERWRVRREGKKAKLKSINPASIATALPAEDVTTGNYQGLCLLIEFPDVAHTISRQEIDNFCNKPGYSGYSNNGSVRDYFFDNSKGKLTYTNQVTEYYTAAHNRSYYTDPSVSYGTRARELITEALNHLKANGFDFSGLTSDSGGYIYALNVFYVGPRVNNWSEGLWPHSWSLASPYDAGGGKKFFDYQITNIGSSLALRTFCHENGHMICNFPDLYDYGYESYGSGNYCLMAFGANDLNPCQVCAYLKNEAGWSTSVTEITSGITASLTASDNDFYTFTKNNDEYFIIENRQRSGRDTHLPDDGLMIWHVDESGSNNNEQMTPSQHYECSLEQADNKFDLEHKANPGDSEDSFNATGNNTFSDTTSPASKWWDGSNSGLNISQISASAPTMTFASAATSGWINNKQVLYTYSHTNSKYALAIIDGLSGWKRIAPSSTDGVTNVLDLLKVAKANNRNVNTYIDSNDQITAVVML